MDFYEDYRSAPWERVTRKVVDPITFLTTANIESFPRNEECAYETTGSVLVEPRFGEKFVQTRSGVSDGQDSSWTPINANVPTMRSKKKFSQYSGTPKSKKNSLKDTLKGRSASLGAFFQKSSIGQLEQDMDNASLGSKSMNSRSIADRSNAERSKSEDKLKRRNRRKRRSSGSKESRNSRNSSIPSKESPKEIQDEQKGGTDLGSVGVSSSIDEFNPDRWNEGTKENHEISDTMDKMDANHSIIVDGKDEDEKSLTLEEVGLPVIEKKVRFMEGVGVREIPYPTNSMYDDLFWGSEELADFRYEAFLEEAGLEVDNYL